MKQFPIWPKRWIYLSNLKYDIDIAIVPVYAFCVSGNLVPLSGFRLALVDMISKREMLDIYSIYFTTFLCFTVLVNFHERRISKSFGLV